MDYTLQLQVKSIINEELVNIENPSVAISKGIGMVHQHFMLIGTFTVAQNIILGSETTKFMGSFRYEQSHKRCRRNI